MNDITNILVSLSQNNVYMGKLVRLYEENPDDNLINEIVERLERGAIIIFPTDSFYSFGCSLNCQKSINNLIALKEKKDKNLAIICSDLKMVSNYIHLDNDMFKLLKQNTPNPFTFVFELNKRLPNSFLECKKTVGVRIPNNKIATTIVERLTVPLVSTSVALRNCEKEDSFDPSLIWDEYGDKIDYLIDAGFVAGVPSAVVSLCGGEIEIIREGSVELDY